MNGQSKYNFFGTLGDGDQVVSYSRLYSRRLGQQERSVLCVPSFFRTAGTDMEMVLEQANAATTTKRLQDEYIVCTKWWGNLSANLDTTFSFWHFISFFSHFISFTWLVEYDTGVSDKRTYDSFSTLQQRCFWFWVEIGLYCFLCINPMLNHQE